MTKKTVLDLYFMDARSKLIDIAAFLDRVDRGEGEVDFRLEAFKSALAQVQNTGSGRAREVLMTLSDPSVEPIPFASTKVACGAFEPK